MINYLRNILLLVILISYTASYSQSKKEFFLPKNEYMQKFRKCDNIQIKRGESSNLNLIGHLPYGPCWTAKARGDYVFLGYGLYFRIIDVSDPEHPEDVSQILMDSFPEKLFIQDNYAYLLNREGLYIINISDIRNPKITSVFEYSGEWKCTEIFIKDNFAYLLDWNDGLIILDISSKSNPEVLGTYLEITKTYDFYVSGDYAFIAHGQEGLTVLDISDPENPFELNRFGEDFINTIDSKNNYAFIFSFEKLSVLDVNNPASPVLVGECKISGFLFQTCIKDNRIYIIDDFFGFRIINIEDLTAPYIENYLRVGDYSLEDVTVSGNYAFLANSSRGLEIINIEDLLNIQKLNTYDEGNFANDIGIYKNFVYINDFYEFNIINTGNPKKLKTIQKIQIKNFAEHKYSISILYQYYNYICLKTDEPQNTLRVYDVSLPVQPREVNAFKSTGGNSIFVFKNYAYVIFPSDIRVFDITDPVFPEETGSVDINIYLDYVFCKDSSRLFTAKSNEILVYSFSGASDINKIKSIQVETEPVSMAVKGKYLFTAENRGEDGVSCLGIIDWHKNEYLNFFPIEDYITGLYIQNDKAYLSGCFGIKIIDIKSLENPFEIAAYTGYFYKIRVSNDYVYATSKSSGLYIFEYDENEEITLPSEYYLKQNYPNPFNSYTTIEFLARKNITGTIKIYNILGREVRTLFGGDFDTGINRFIWDGTNNTGNEVNSGIYFCTLRTDNFKETIKIVFLK